MSLLVGIVNGMLFVFRLGLFIVMVNVFNFGGLFWLGVIFDNLWGNGVGIDVLFVLDGVWD